MTERSRRRVVVVTSWQGAMMHPTARRCIQWAVGLLVVGAVLLVYGTDLYAGVAEIAGANAQIGLDLLDVVLTLIRNLAFPLGASLVAAAIVIETLTGHSSTQEHAQSAARNTNER